MPPWEGTILRGKGTANCKVLGHCCHLCKNGSTNRDAIWDAESGEPREPLLDGGPGPPWEGAVLRGKSDMSNDTLT